MMRQLSDRMRLGIALIILMAGTSAMTQIPASLERELDQYNEKIYQALEILSTEQESEAISRVKGIKDELAIDGASLLAKLEALPELSEEQDEAFMEKQIAKPLYQKVMILLSDQAFMQKMENSPALMKEYTDLMVLMDLGASEEEEEMEYE